MEKYWKFRVESDMFWVVWFFFLDIVWKIDCSGISMEVGRRVRGFFNKLGNR